MSATATTSSSKVDMLNGPLLRNIVSFAIPLMASGVLQQSFNAVDVAVVGRFCSSQALAAVGSNGMVINTLLNLFIGVSVGANVVIANYIGRRNNSGIRNAIATTSVFAIASGVVLTFLGYFLTRPILEWMNSPADVIDLATTYLKIYFLGMPFLMIYNFGAAILRSMGDTRRPFYSLVVAGVVNTLLNLLLVIKFGMSVEGVAIATVVANAINAAFIVYWLLREPKPYTLELRKMRIHTSDLSKMMRIGIPAGLQGMVFSVANIFIQATINGYGSAAVAGSSAALYYEIYCYFIMTAFCQATVAFTSQNFGAGNHHRCVKVYRICMLLSIICCALTNIVITLFPKTFIGVFSTDPEVLHYAVMRLQCVLLVQFIASSYEISGSALRGLGFSMTPTLLTIAGTCVLRLAWIYFIPATHTDFRLLMIVYPISWIITGILVTVAYFRIEHKLFRTNTKSV